VCPHRDSDVQQSALQLFVWYTSTSVLALPAGAVSLPSGGEANLVRVTGSATFIRRPGAADDVERSVHCSVH
jgi:hypothetical protein